MSRIV